MKAPRLRLLTIILALGASALLCSCGDDDPADPYADSGCIGRAGGTVAITDTTDFLVGVSFHVPPDTWTECWAVYLMYHSTFSTPNFPDGLEGYEGWLTGGIELDIGRGVEDQWIGAPDSLDFELTLPLRDLTVEPGEKIVAFRYDDQAGLYRLVMPIRQDDRSITVRGHHTHQLWTWGKVDLAEVDFATYLTPVMEELHGAGGWLEIQAELSRLQAEAVANQTAITCASLRIIRGALAAAGDAAADHVRAIQDAMHGRCGVCDATSEAFYDELGEFLKYQVGTFLTDLIFNNSRHLLFKIYGFIMCSYMQYCIDELDCDFECFADAVDLEFYVYLGYFYACTVTVEVIDWAMTSGYIDCPPAGAELSTDHGPLPAGGWGSYFSSSSFRSSTRPALSRRAR